MAVDSTPPPSWEVFGFCNKCGADNGGPCYNLKKSTSRKLVEATTVHPGRERLKDYVN